MHSLHKVTHEVEATLDTIDKKFLNSFCAVETEGKSRKKPEVLVHLAIFEAMKLLIATRKDVGINKQKTNKNPYMFAMGSGSLQSIRVDKVINKLRSNPSMTGTNLRKHIATVSKIISLDGIQTENLARHLSHSMDIHRQYSTYYVN